MDITHPYDDLTGGQWLRGNLHAHSTRSDGTRDPQVVIDDYSNRGYDFLMLSDHDVWCSEDDYQGLDPRGMVLICGNEISAQGTHTLHVGAHCHIRGSRCRQEALNAINEGPGFAVVCHPNRGVRQTHATIEQLREWCGYVGMEIFNGSGGEGSDVATGKWDMLLVDGRRVWGFANDDCHRGDDDIENGWNVAYTRDRSAAGVLEALRVGRFYASTGVTISNIEVKGDRIRVETEDAQHIIARMNGGKRFERVDDRAIEVTVPGFAQYVRFECVGAGGRTAWTQPFFVEKPPKRERSAAEPAKTFIDQWQVSPLFPGVEFFDAEAVSPDASDQPWDFVKAHTQGPNRGFADARERVAKQPGVIYFSTLIESPRDQHARLYFGYDGPVRIWLNDQRIFEGPGANPARADRTALFGELREGENRLTVALGTNRGLAWGIYGRVETDDDA